MYYKNYYIFFLPMRVSMFSTRIDVLSVYYDVLNNPTGPGAENKMFHIIYWKICFSFFHFIEIVMPFTHINR